MQTFTKVGLDALTPENCVLLLLTTGPSNWQTSTVTTPEKRGGVIFKQIQAVFPDQKPIDRTFINAWEDARVVEAVKKTQRKKLVIAELWKEMSSLIRDRPSPSGHWRLYRRRRSAHGLRNSQIRSPVRRAIIAVREEQRLSHNVKG